MGLSKQLKNQSSLVRSGVPLPHWWPLATIVGGCLGAFALIFTVLSPSTDAGSASFPAIAASADTSPFDAASTSSSNASPSTQPVPSTPPANSDLDASLEAFVLSEPLTADGRLVQVTGPTGGQQALEANLVVTAQAGALAQYSSAVAAQLPVTGKPVTASKQASTLEVDEVALTGVSSGAYVFTVTLNVDGAVVDVPVAVSDTAKGFAVVT